MELLTGIVSGISVVGRSGTSEIVKIDFIQVMQYKFQGHFKDHRGSHNFQGLQLQFFV